jgi:hypothetical protein
MVGAMVLARLVDDETLSKEILSATRASLPLAGCRAQRHERKGVPRRPRPQEHPNRICN